MLNFDLLKLVLISSIASSIITTATVQKIKENLRSKKFLTLISFGVSMIIGTLFSLSFSELNIINNLWVGFITFLGADAIYKAFEDKIFKSFSSIENAIYIERKDKKDV